MTNKDSFIFSIERPNSVCEDAVEFMLSECTKALINDDHGVIEEAFRVLGFEYHLSVEDINVTLDKCLNSIAQYGIHLEAIRARKTVSQVACLVRRNTVRMTLHWR